MISQHQSLDPNTCIAFIGGGNMAKAIISGLLKQGHNSANILVCAPSQTTRHNLIDKFNIRVHQDNTAAVAFADVIIVAVKPFVVPVVCEQLSEVMQHDNRKLVISIAVGIKHTTICQKLNHSPKVICAMPNLPAAIGEGLTGLFAGPNTHDNDIALAESLMRAVGETVWLQDESQMSTIVAAAGSSPAYLFLFLEAMEKAAIKQGLPKEIAIKAVLHSAMGAISMAINSQHNLTNLRHQVTSPKGTTEQAILAFQDGELDELVASAMACAATRAKELSIG
ncbi:pyrroline-5-carboxylate reductase [Shewanella psychromarinicola]|uniref:pyrroline-5-carboxylate reductase n=1 Tax=Shewanella psychromarinicola TaxID=2487742 RepID=UPI003F4C301D